MKKLCCLLVLGLFWGRAYAVQPLPPLVNLDIRVPISVTGAALPGAVLHVENREDIPLVLEIRPGMDSTIVFEPVRVSLASGRSMDIPLILPIGRHLFDVFAVLFDTLGNPLRDVRPSLYQPLMVSESGLVSKLSFEQAFLNSRDAIVGDSDKANIDLGGFVDSSEIGRFAFRSTGLPAGTYVEPVDAPSPLVLAAMPLGQLPDLSDLFVIQPAEGAKPQSNGASIPGAALVPLAPLTASSDSIPTIVGTARTFLGADSVLTPATGTALGGSASPASLVGVAALMTFKGNLSLKITDSTYKSAWGWVVRVWQKQPVFIGPIFLFDVWRFLGWAYVAGDGSWQVQVDSSAVRLDRQVWIEYRTANRFVQLQDANGNVYTWGDNWNLGPGGVDTGARYANLTVNGNLPAVDRLYVGGTDIWVKFYNTGMNALRNAPIQVTFPNSLASGHCIYNKDGSGNTVPNYAWSCSEGSGNIWLVPQHGFAFVVQHELGHSIHSFYHGGFPPGSGSAHNLTGCYNGGLALTEGFANFLAYWVEFERTALNPVAQYANFNIESPDNGACTDPKGNNETWVAANFWDMYDYWNDGPGGNQFDSLYYINQAVPVAIFLNNKRNTMPDYLPVVKNGQSAFWQGEFEKLFRLNNTIP